MRFGLALPHYDTSFAGEPATWSHVVAAAQTAEASGFDSVWVSDHLFLDWGKYGGSSERRGALECWTTLSGLAGVTERLRLGSLAICNDLRHPALLAKMIATLDAISGGRVDVTLGAGWYEPEYEAAAIPFDRAAIRIRRMGEAVSIVARLLQGEELTYEGEHYELRGAIVRPGPVQDPRPAIFVGGKGNLLLDTAAQVADGWNYSWLGSLEDYLDRLAVARAACEAVDRDPDSLRRSVGAYVVTGKDDADARRRFERLVSRTPQGVLTGSSGVSWEGFKGSKVAGTTGEVVDVLGRLAETGVEEVILTLGALPFQLSDLEDVELIGSDVIPALG